DGRPLLRSLRARRGGCETRGNNAGGNGAMARNGEGPAGSGRRGLGPRLPPPARPSGVAPVYGPFSAGQVLGTIGRSGNGPGVPSGSAALRTPSRPLCRRPAG